MPRPRKPRNCVCPHRAGYSAVFKPAGTPLKDLEIIQLAHDELETLYLCDAQNLHQERAGEMMGISRGTVQRLLTSARSKVAQALVGQKALAISGSGNEMVTGPGECDEKKQPDCTKGTAQ